MANQQPLMSNSIVASIGLISDTHFQYRLFDLPTGLEKFWADVNLILHAGDVGELDVLDLLGKFAPTIAVHGNDEPDYVKKALPSYQLVTVHGVRILLWHSHYFDPIEEKANRIGAWGPKLERIANRGQEVNARIVVYGHTHVPMVYRQNDMLLINPGALAAGSYFTRQKMSSIGKLQLYTDGKLKIVHFDVDANQERVFDEANRDDEFDLLAKRYQEWIVEPDMISNIGILRQTAYEDISAVVRTIVPLYKRCLLDGLMRRDDLISVINSSDLITPKDKKNILSAINRCQ